ncbi:hypothetical protein PORY_001323 [Pneumocystis oryctolagi]|uniref:Uncharacterized protein n=1 Tax=Pneumocystis oryctolagi TaxID=42067 RepID=A0ACB7CDX2_9ASCO|nr:hypothetical protein PORY_001323 [Pneumocystis oryctolagi]
MTRIIIKNLPKYLNEDRFKEHFSSYCGKHITDIRFIRSKNRKFRGFGFIGYKTKEDALNAIKYYNNTFIDTSRIIVEHAREIDFNSVGSKNSLKYSYFSSEDSIQEENDKLISDELFLKESQESKESFIVSKHKKIGSSIDASNVDQNCLIREDRFKNCVNNPDDINNDALFSSVSDAKNSNEYLSFSTSSGNESVIHTKTMTDNEWLKSKSRKIIESDDFEFLDSSSNKQLNTEDVFFCEKNDSEYSLDNNNKSTPKEEILLSGRLFVRNLPYNISENELRVVFEEFGKVIDVHVPFDFSLNMTKGFAYILFEDPLCAVNAYENMDGRALYGRLIHVLPAQLKNCYDKFMSSNKVKFKNQRAKKRKINALCSQFSWNSLYMNPDAVMSSVADKLGVSKIEVLDPTCSDASIKLALAETHIIQETKAFLEKSGVNLESFSGFERDDCVLLVKNFSYGTTINELFELFGKYGSLGRVLLPPSGTIAIVEFLEPRSANDAFKHLSYRKFKDSILYLEKAPINVFKEKFDPKMNSKIVDLNTLNLKTIYDTDINIENSDIVDTERSTLFIKNINFSTTLDGLKNAFCSLDGFVNAVIKMKPDPKRPGNKLSMGFGFVEFRTRSQALQAMCVMKNYVLDGHVLQIKESEKSHGFSVKEVLNQNKNKIIIKNLPFEATKKDVRQLFGSYGHLKSVRVPKKIDHSIRGFAFVEYVTSRDAKNAFNILKNTHLLGRHLILEWAFDDSFTNDLDVKRKTIEKSNDR